MANLYSIALRRRPYRTYTHSIGGLRRLFAEAGFPRNQGYGLTPGYSKLEEVVPTATSDPKWAAARAPTIQARLRRSELFVPAFGMIGRGGAGRVDPLISRILAEISHRVPQLAPLAILKCEVTPGERIVLRLLSGGATLFLKLPVAPYAMANEENSARTLAALAANRRLEGLLPKPVVNGVHQAVRYYLETALDGAPLRSAEGRTRMSRDAAAKAVGEVLVQMQQSDSGVFLGPSAEDLSFAEIQAPLALIAAAGAPHGLCEGLRSELRRRLAPHQWKAGLRHGRLEVDNILVAEATVTGVLGWGDATWKGLPALDAIAYVASMGRLHEPDVSPLALLKRLAQWNWPNDGELALVRASYARLGIDPSRHEDLCMLAAFRAVAHESAGTARFDPDYVGRVIEPLGQWIRSV